MLQFCYKTSQNPLSDAAEIRTLAGWVPALGDGPLRRGPVSLTCGRVQGMGRTKQARQEHAPCRLAMCFVQPVSAAQAPFGIV